MLKSISVITNRFENWGFRGIFLQSILAGRASLARSRPSTIPFPHSRRLYRMNKFVLSGSLLALMAFNAAAQDAPKKTQNEPPKRGIHWAKGHAPAVRTGGNPDMTWHSRAIMTSAGTNAIFWGPSWATSPGDKISGIDKWY